jgi:hypothetical protein
VRHHSRPDLAALVRQRVAYGSSAGPLAARHGDAVVPVRAAPLPVAGWVLVAAGHPLAGIATGVAGAVPLARTIGAGREGATAAAILALRGFLGTGRQLATAITRPWWPLAVAAAVVSRRARLVVGAAALVPPLLDWTRRWPHLDPVRYTALRLVDDAAYGVGVWRGVMASGRLAPLRPALTGRIALRRVLRRRRDGRRRAAPSGPLR